MIWIFHIVSVISIFGILKICKKEKWIIPITFMYSIFIFGQRWMTGEDFPNYLRYYLLKFEYVEFIYKFIQNIFRDYNLYFGLFIFLIFTVTNYYNYKLIIKLSENKNLTIFLYLISEIYFAQMSQIRQFIAISFWGMAMYYMHKKKWWKVCSFILLAYGFHDTVIFLIPFLFIVKGIRREIKERELRMLFIVIGILPLVNLKWIASFTKYSHYINGKYDVGLSFAHYIKFYFALVMGYCVIRELKNINEKKVLIRNCFIIYLFFYGISMQFAPMLRISYYFKIYELFIFTEGINLIKENSWFISRNFKKKYLFEKNFIIPIILITASLGIYAFFGVVDLETITRYKFRPLKIFQDKSDKELWKEIGEFWD